jgi:hypothetical protein
LQCSKCSQQIKSSSIRKPCFVSSSIRKKCSSILFRVR